MDRQWAALPAAAADAAAGTNWSGRVEPTRLGTGEPRSRRRGDSARPECSSLTF